MCCRPISWDASSALGHPYQEEEEEEEEEECRRLLFASAIQNPISRFDVQVRDSTVCVFDFFLIILGRLPGTQRQAIL